MLGCYEREQKRNFSATACAEDKILLRSHTGHSAIVARSAPEETLRTLR
jgi:hypothetical protein